MKFSEGQECLLLQEMMLRPITRKIKANKKFEISSVTSILGEGELTIKQAYVMESHKKSLKNKQEETLHCWLPDASVTHPVGALQPHVCCLTSQTYTLPKPCLHHSFSLVTF